MGIRRGSGCVGGHRMSGDVRFSRSHRTYLRRSMYRVGLIRRLFVPGPSPRLDERESRVKNSDRKSNNWIPRPEFGVSCLVRAMSRVRKRIRRWRTCRGFRHTSRSLHRVSVSSAPLIFRSFVKIYVSIDNLYA